MKNVKLSFKGRSALYGFLFISPWLLGFIWFFLIPFIQSIVFSFGDISFNQNGYHFQFAGTVHYMEALTKDVEYPKKLVASITGLFADVPIVLVFSFFIALLLKQKFRGNAVSKAIFFLPIIMASGIFVSLQSSSSDLNAVVNSSIHEASQSISMLKSMNLENYLLEAGLSQKIVGYLTGPIDSIYRIITISGIQTFIFLAGLNSIPPSLYEACYIEGAGGWETFWKITFPMMMPMLLVNVVYSIIDTFTSVTNQVMSYVYSQAFTFYKFGFSSAMCLIYVAVLTVIMGIAVFFINRKVFYYT